MRAFNSTIQRKEKRCKKCGLLKYIFSHGLCKECARTESILKSDAKNSTDDTESVAILKEDADILFSRVIRLRSADDTGWTWCYICGVPIKWQEAQNMHYVGRLDSSLRYHEKNCKSGCATCNEFLDGNLAKYAEKLESDEPGITEWLYVEGNIPYKFDREELKQKIIDWTKEINYLRKTKNI